MTVCFFGNYIWDYPRIAVMRKGLQKNGIVVLECRTRKKGVAKFVDLYRKHRQVKDKYDAILVCMGGQTLVWFAKILSNKKVYFDAFVSLYLTNIEDRRIARHGSIRAKYFAFWDMWSCRLADFVFLDTEAQINYYAAKYNLPREKFARVFVGADDEVFFPKSSNPRDNSKGRLLVHWHGYIVPFHGLKIVLEAAAKIQKNFSHVEFEIVTRFDSKYEKMKELAMRLNLSNLRFIPETGYDNLAFFVNRADICLGVFGDNPKARLVIPNKIYEALACAKPLITGRHTAIAELLEDKKNVILTNPEDSDDLASKILWVWNHAGEGAQIARKGYEIYQNHLAPAVIGLQLKQILFS